MDRDLEMKAQSSILSDGMLVAVSELIENLVQSEPFLKYQEAQNKLQADPEAMRLLAELSEMQQNIRAQQYAGNFSEEDLSQLRKLQSEVYTQDVIQEHGYAQELAVAFLREVNQEISSLIGVDFASLARRSDGAC